MQSLCPATRKRFFSEGSAACCQGLVAYVLGSCPRPSPGTETEKDNHGIPSDMTGVHALVDQVCVLLVLKVGH